MASELILIIEDNEVNRIRVRDMLRFKGYRTVETQTAEEGLRVAREQKPALILMDFHLPKMNGIEGFRGLRVDPETNAIPVIAVTASAMPKDRKYGFWKRGSTGYRRNPSTSRVSRQRAERAEGLFDTRVDSRHTPRCSASADWPPGVLRGRGRFAG